MDHPRRSDPRVPGGDHGPAAGLPADRPGARARRDPGAQPGHLRHHLDGAGGTAPDHREPVPQLHRPRRVSADRRDRAALHPHARPPLPRSGRDHRRPHPGLLGGDHARRPVAEVEVARAPGEGRQVHRQAQPGLRRRRARRLGEVLPLLRRRAAHRPAAARQVHDRPRGRGAAHRREHDRRRRRARDHVHRPRRRHRRHQQAPRGAQGRQGARRPAARRRCERRLRVALPASRLRVGLPARAGALDQRLRAQVRDGLSRGSAGSSSARRPTSPRTWSSTRTTSARPTPRSPSTSPPARRWSWRSTTR